MLVLGDSVHCLSAMRCFAPQEMDLGHDQYNSFFLCDKPHFSPAPPGVFFPSLHHPFPLPGSPHTITSDKRNCQSYLISFPLCPSSVICGDAWRTHSWAQLEEAQLGTALKHSQLLSFHPSILSSSSFTSLFLFHSRFSPLFF